MKKKVQSFSGNWVFRQSGTDEWLPAVIPGGVHTDLLSLGLIPDPFVGDNELEVMWVAEVDWEYKYSFHTNSEILANKQIYLVADGLDTLAEVKLNGQVLGTTNNQFRQWRWEVKGLLKGGDNTLEIRFSGPSSFVAAEQQRRQMKGVMQAIDGGPHLRKAPCQFGWDWGPMLPPIGIWKDIRLEGYNRGWIDDVHLRQVHDNKGVTILAEVKVNILDQRSASGLQIDLIVTTPSGEVLQGTFEIIENESSLEVQVEDPLLWWPHGYGEQNLYDVSLKLKERDSILDDKQYQLGLRTVELRQEEDDFGKSFQFVVNGVPIFAKGSNWIPADAFITRFPDQDLEALISAAAASHQNMLRVWGGGFYEEERFYDLCDRYGILVWQDFIFSCAIYPLDKADFHENVRIEVEENIKRLRHRTSLVLWCGNNEMEWGWESWGWQKHPMEDSLPALLDQFPELRPMLDSIGDRDPLSDWEVLKDAYDQFFHHTLPKWVGDYDPDTPYWPSSPSSDTPFYDVNSQNQGDAHYWDVWHGRKPFTAYRGTHPRFMSEFGFQAFPSIETVEFYTQPEDRNLTSYIMEHHQRGNHGNGLIIAQMTETFRMPKDFEAWIYLSQVLQAEGIRYGVEHWRRQMHRVSGTLYWQLNDCWPVASWSSIDYFGRWKALHYAAKRFYAPLLLSIEDKPPMMDVHLSSDMKESWQGTLKWSLETLIGEVVKSGSLETNAQPLEDTLIKSFDFRDLVNKENERQLVFTCQLWKGEAIITTSMATFVPNKHLSFVDPKLKITTNQEGDKLVIAVAAESLARFIELKLTGADVIFSDNYFDVPAGRTVMVSCPNPEGWSLEDVESVLTVYSLYDSFT